MGACCLKNCKVYRFIQSGFIVVLMLCVLLSLSVFYLLYIKSLLPRGHSVALVVARGATIEQVARQLQQLKVYEYPKLFVFIVRLRGDARRLRYGQYHITASLSIMDLLDHLITGQGQVRHKITFIEGWTFRDIRQALTEDNNLQHELTGKTNKQIMRLLHSAKTHSEGLFFPDTYVFIWGNSDIDILRQAYQKMQTLLREQWLQRAPGLPYKNAYQALIVASMIEKETAIKRERAKIAGVILRRLRKRMRLQVDPTVLYGLGKPYGTVITKKDLRKKTPYNTYLIYGLPPTPIDMPSLSSIHAALHPAAGNALYYVALGDGHHQFSVNYQQHQVAVRRYRQLQREVVILQQLPQRLENSPIWHHPWVETALVGLRLLAP